MESMARLRDAVKRDSILISQYLDSLRSTPQERMRRALTFSPSEWKPTEADRARRAEEIWRSQGFDKIFGNIPRVQLMSVPLGHYVAEVVVGRRLVLRKRIEVP